jgi:hypothetical protein
MEIEGWKMGKIDYSKVEEKLSHALHSTMVKRIVKGEPTVSSEAVNYYALNDGKRPKRQDPVIEALDEMRREAREIELEELRKQGLLPPESVSLQAGKETDTEAPKEEESSNEEIPTTDATPKIFPPLFLLRKHLAWFKKKKVDSVYSTLGVTEEYMYTLYEKETLSPEEEAKVEELEKKAADLRDNFFEKMGVGENNSYVEKERKKHISKRFKVRENWLPLDTH